MTHKAVQSCVEFQPSSPSTETTCAVAHSHCWPLKPPLRVAPCTNPTSSGTNNWRVF